MAPARRLGEVPFSADMRYKNSEPPGAGNTATALTSTDDWSIAMARGKPFTGAPKQQYICETCGAAKMQWPSQVKSHFYCSRACFNKSLVGRPWCWGNAGRRLVAAKACKNCGGEIVGTPSTVRKRSFCCQDCSGAYYSGAKHPLWVGGASKWRSRIGLTKEYKAWRVSVITRDGGLCRWCLHDGVKKYHRLEVHHIIPVAKAPESVFDIGNAITLCRDHHMETKGRENEYAEFFASLLQTKLVAPPTANKRSAPVSVTKEDLNRMYWIDGMSTIEIAKIKGIHPTYVQLLMRKYGLPRRSNRDARLNQLRKLKGSE